MAKNKKQTKPSKPSVNTLWGGRFDAQTSDIMQEINASINFDKRLYKQDLAGSRAHCQMLIAQGIISKNDGDDILMGLEQIENEFEKGEFDFNIDLEDIHMHIENRLLTIVGEKAGRLHTARSRNDQVATDFRLWIRDSIDTLSTDITTLQKALIERAEEHYKTIMPGFTHMQVAQPVTLGHHLLAYAQMAERDQGRLADCRSRLNESPLGAGALAGTSFPIDRHSTASMLGFDRPMNNSLDAVSSRDFAIEFVAACSITALHLSRLAEEIVLWMSAPFSFASLSDEFSTGSSMMPQKRNPDAAELIRAKPGRIMGDLNALMIILKGLPLAYCKDIQEDKEPVFDATDSLRLCLAAMTGMVHDLEFNVAKMRTIAASGHSTATDLADWLALNLNLPFREAHFTTGLIVKRADELNCELHQLSLEDMQQIEPRITDAVFGSLNIETSINNRTSFGGTAPTQVFEAIGLLKKKLL